MAWLPRSVRRRGGLNDKLRVICSSCVIIPSRKYASPPGTEYGLEKKWAYYNQSAIDNFSSKALTKLTPHQMLYAGKSSNGSHLIKSAQYLHKELPKRVARRVKDLQNLPYVVAINPTMQEVYELYLRAFYKLSSYKPIENLDEELQYSNLVQKLLDDHKDVVTSLAKAVNQVKSQIQYEEMSKMVERILTSRLGIRILAEHHIGLRNERENYIGIICTHMSVRNLIEKCVFYCREMCQHNYGIAPSVAINGHVKATFPYLPPPLEYMIQELLKNAMKATVLHHRDKVKAWFSDSGGGIHDSKMQRIFDYAFTTTKEEEATDGDKGGLDSLVKAAHVAAVGGAMSGYGFGLPTTRAYASFLGGTLEVYTLYGLGTDVYLKLGHINGPRDSFRI
ncbi:branched-chain alpha-ketoacid dehydrogenase kinase-like isoform X2 [Rhopilema esculentum]|uniref:branched-chain alpha-ketoacid dehydrogenase kinase-like isoform X2 n=1 Tax=Rhopilema esculentum TaxID=499914 RepID=UPI0031D8F576